MGPLLIINTSNESAFTFTHIVFIMGGGGAIYGDFKLINYQKPH